MSPTWSTRPTMGAEQNQPPCELTGISSGDFQEMNTCMVQACHAIPASPKPSCRAPWRAGDAVVGKRNAGWTTSKSEHPYPRQSCSQWPPTKRLDEDLRCPIPIPTPMTLSVRGTELSLTVSLLFVLLFCAAGDDVEWTPQTNME